MGKRQADKKAQMDIILQTPLDWANCPSRRKPLVAPWTGVKLGNVDSSVSIGAKADYAVNVGDTSNPCSSGSTVTWTGICYEKSEISTAKIFDGTSNTYMLGEKYLSADNYLTGTDSGDNKSMYVGFNEDTSRTTYYTPCQDQTGPPDSSLSFSFGSAHDGGFFMALCDGSVRMINYSIAPDIHRLLGNRKDGKPIDASKL